jgi:23S rRNA (cytosine1962-C5)-methyltransferase
MEVVTGTRRLDQVPGPAAQRLAVRLTPDALRQIRGGHPWVYDRAIANVSNPDATSGDLAVVFDADRRFAAIGLWDPSSPIRLRILHHGKPVTIDAAWFTARIAAAVERRATLVTDATTTGYRVVHGENDGLPGLVVDRYDNVLVVKLDTGAWVPHLAALVPALRAVVPARSVIVRFARQVVAASRHGLVDGQTVLGDEVREPVGFRELGLNFEADVVRGQKTGWFLDQRDNRARAAAHARGADVLDVFSNAGGFSVHAAAAGARSVTLVDSSVHALAAARRHLELNGADPNVAACRVDTIEGDAFDVLDQLRRDRRRFGLVIVDPPSFAHDAAAVPAALEAYARLTTAAVGLLTRSGVLVQASCTSRIDDVALARAMHRGAAIAGFDLDEIERTGHGVDHPIGFPEGSYLCAVFTTAAKRPRSAGVGRGA